MSSAEHDGEIVVSVRDYTRVPGARYYEDGKFSGQWFREEVLLPAFERALQSGDVVLVDLDGTNGYATSFLEEAFGGLARHFKNAELVLKHIRLKTLEEPLLQDEVHNYIRAVQKSLK